MINSGADKGKKGKVLEVNPKDNTVVVEDENEIVSSLQLNQYKIQLNNKEYDSSYVVGVSTLPEARGRGYMKHIMDFTLNELYRKNQLVSILMPIDYRLYRKYEIY